MAKKLNKKQLARLNKGLALAQQAYRRNAIPQTVEHCQTTLTQQPDNPIAHRLLGLIAYRSKLLPQAITHFMAAISAEPENFSHYVNLGLVYIEQGDARTALDHFKKALKLNPQAYQAYNNIGFIYSRTGEYREAINAYHQSLRIDANRPETHENLAVVLEKLGHFGEAAEHYRAAIELSPATTRDAQSNLLFMQACYCLCTSDDLLKQHRDWDALQRAGKIIGRWPSISEPDPDRRLRIGYVSADFHQHPVARFMEPLLSAHDRSQVDIFCYAEIVKYDAITERLQSLSDHWRQTTGLSNGEVERMIRRDKIDILIDLGGHTAFNRLSVFIRRPAPIQATYLGYCASTGMEAMDYWISDSALHPPDTKERASESIYRLTRCWVCYQAPEGAPEIKQRDANPGRITFGSLNNVHKMSDDVYQTWAEILNRLPGSRLLLKSGHLATQGVADEVLRKFSLLEIDPSRIELQTKTPPPDFLTVYNEIDIALDTFPRTGGTTAADALWMGVPVITLAGERYVERLVASKLEAIGRPEWIATNPQEYIEKAVGLAKNPALLKEVRATQRQQVEQSPLCDGKGLAHSMEQAYREMWENFLSSAN